MKLDDQSKKLQLAYPCEWTYKVIGNQPERLKAVIHEMMQGRPYSVSLSNRSKTKKYCSLNLVIQVENEADRNAIYQRLKNHAETVMVL
jgi:uncharacterized protein